MSAVLVTGGAGYIGSHTSLQLTEMDYDVVVLDNLYSGHQWAVSKGADFYQGDIADPEIIRKIFKQHDIDAVVHFAGHIVVPESVADPLKYYRNNVSGSLNPITSEIESKCSWLLSKDICDALYHRYLYAPI